MYENWLNKMDGRLKILRTARPIEIPKTTFHNTLNSPKTQVVPAQNLFRMPETNLLRGKPNLNWTKISDFLYAH